MTTYGLVAIVKDAGASIDAMLASAAPYISVATLVDTGSTDDTGKRIKAAGWQVHKRQWRNFGHNRSQAFAMACGTADWLLALDADMTVEIDPDFVPDPAVEAYMVEMGDSGLSWRLPLLLRGDLPWVSRGAVHEYTSLPNRGYVSQPTDKVRVRFPPTQSSPSKRHWHAGLLEEELAREPDNPRTVFYLAQTYRELGDPRARDLYLRRATMGGFADEVWYAKYRAALLSEWPARAGELMAAWEAWPVRLEPLYHLVRELNRRGTHHAAYHLAVVPGDLPTALFVEPGVWAWGLDFERSIAAWYVGHQDESRELGEHLLTLDLPADIRAAVERNLALTGRMAA